MSNEPDTSVSAAIWAVVETLEGLQEELFAIRALMEEEGRKYPK